MGIYMMKYKNIDLMYPAIKKEPDGSWLFRTVFVVDVEFDVSEDIILRDALR